MTRNKKYNKETNNLVYLQNMDVAPRFVSPIPAAKRILLSTGRAINQYLHHILHSQWLKRHWNVSEAPRVKYILVPRGCVPFGQHQESSDWLKMRNDYSTHTPKIGPSQKLRILVLTKRSAASTDENTWLANCRFLAIQPAHVRAKRWQTGRWREQRLTIWRE